MQKIIAIGGEGMLKECIYYAQQSSDYDFLGFAGLDGFVPDLGENFSNLYLGQVDSLNLAPDISFIICAGSCKLREELYEGLIKRKLHVTNFIYNSTLSPFIEIGSGNTIVNSTLTVDVKIGNCNLFNTGCVVGHDVVVGDFNSFSPNTHLLGGVKVGSNNLLGTSVVVCPKAKIGSRNTISPNSVILKGCRDDAYYHGNPARKL